MAISEDAVFEQLSQVFDPDLPGVNIVELGLIYKIEFEAMEEDAEQTRVKIEMTLTSPMCPAGPQLVGQSKQFVSQLEGVGDVEVKVVMDPPWSPEKMTEDARDKLGIF